MRRSIARERARRICTVAPHGQCCLFFASAPRPRKPVYYINLNNARSYFVHVARGGRISVMAIMLLVFMSHESETRTLFTLLRCIVVGTATRSARCAQNVLGANVYFRFRFCRSMHKFMDSPTKRQRRRHPKCPHRLHRKTRDAHSVLRIDAFVVFAATSTSTSTPLSWRRPASI